MARRVWIRPVAVGVLRPDPREGVEKQWQNIMKPTCGSEFKYCKGHPNARKCPKRHRIVVRPGGAVWHRPSYTQRRRPVEKLREESTVEARSPSSGRSGCILSLERQPAEHGLKPQGSATRFVSFQAAGQPGYRLKSGGTTNSSPIQLIGTS